MSACSIDECEKPTRARGWCNAHWIRWKRHGDTNICLTNHHLPLIERFWMKVEKGSDCWNWAGALDTLGYGQFAGSVNGEKGRSMAHRFAYEILVGLIPEGLEVDHRCSNRKCVNPAHLRLATRKQNMEHLVGGRATSATGLRGVSKNRGSYAASVTHDGKKFWGGRHATAEEAAEVAKNLRLELFTHNDADRVA